MYVNSYDNPVRFWNSSMIYYGDVLKKNINLCEHISIVTVIESDDDDCFEYVEQATIYCKVCEEEFTIYNKCN